MKVRPPIAPTTAPTMVPVCAACDDDDDGAGLDMGEDVLEERDGRLDVLSAESTL